MNEYRFEKITESSIPDLVYIYESAFERPVSIEYLKKKQDTSVFGLSYVGFIAYGPNNEPAAFYGVFPCHVSYKGKSYLAAQSGDTMTHKQHTGKGLFTALALRTYEYCRENNVHLVFGFPNENSYPGFVKKLGWQHFDDMSAYHIRLKCLPWIRLKNILPLSASHEKWCRSILSSIPKGKVFNASCLENDTPAVDRSANFFSYKTYSENYLVNINGRSLWLKFDEMFLYIGDMEKCSEIEFLQIIHELKRKCFWMGIPHLRFHSSSNAWAASLFEKYGHKLEASYAVGGVNFSGEVPLELMKFTMADNDTF